MSDHGYEITFVINPTLGEEETVAVAERVTQIITTRGGVVKDISPWGKRRLAYPINHLREGSYVTITFDMDSVRESELEPLINLIEPIIRHVTVRLDERKKARDHRERVAAQRAAAQQAPVAPVSSLATETHDDSGDVDQTDISDDVDVADDLIPPAVDPDIDADEEE